MTEMTEFEQILYTSQELDAKVKELGKRISEDYKGKSITLVGILKGAYVFLSDLSRCITIPHTIEFMRVSSYTGTESSGKIQVKLDVPRDSVENKNVIIVEDILDSGFTLNYLKDHVFTKKCASVECAVLFSKPSQIKKPIDVKYLGFEIDNHFIIGYGLDYNEYFRNLPFIAVPTAETIEKY